jgi:hypothetical protein
VGPSEDDEEPETMRLRLLRRRLAAGSPRLAIRRALPWPVRWALVAVVLGFSAALALWAFEFGRSISGMDRRASEEVRQLREQVRELGEALAQAKAAASASESLLIAERAAQEELARQIRQLQADNQALRNDLGLFERLIPGTGGDGLKIRGLQAQQISDTQLHWQVLMIQARKNAPDFQGVLEVTASGTLAGRPWQSRTPEARSVVVQNYLRQDGIMDLPPGLVVKNVTARLRRGSTVQSEQTIQL